MFQTALFFHSNLLSTTEQWKQNKQSKIKEITFARIYVIVFYFKKYLYFSIEQPMYP